MIEKKQIILNKNDILKIIAEKYGVEIRDVEIEIENGDPQYPSQSVNAVVDLE